MLQFLSPNYHVDHQDAPLQQTEYHVQATVGDIVQIAFHFQQEENEVPKISVMGEQIQDYLYQFCATEAYIGRGMTAGVIPTGPNQSVYDFLKPVANAMIDVSNGYFALLLPVTKKGVLTGEISSHSQVLHFHIDSLPSLEEGDYGLELWQYPYAVARYYGLEEGELFGPRHEKLVKESLLAYHQAGGDTVAVTVVEDPWHHQTYDAYPSLIKWVLTDEGFTFDFSDFDTYLRWNQEVGITGKIKSFSVAPWENRIGYYVEEKLVWEQLEVGSLRWQEVWGQFLQAYGNHLEEKGLFQKTYLALDERPLAEVEAIYQLVQRYPNREGQRFKLSAAVNFQLEQQAVLEYYDDLAISQAYLGEKSDIQKLCCHRRKAHQTTSIYNCVGDYPSMFALSQPMETAYLLWFSESLGVSGFLRWALDAWPQAPHTSISHWFWESGDSLLIYPHQGQEQQVYWTPRFLTLQHTIREIKQYRALKNQAPELVKELTHLLDSLTLPQGERNEYGAQVARHASMDEGHFAETLATIQQMLYEGIQRYWKS